NGITLIPNTNTDPYIVLGAVNNQSVLVRTSYTFNLGTKGFVDFGNADNNGTATLTVAPNVTLTAICKYPAVGDSFNTGAAFLFNGFPTVNLGNNTAIVTNKDLNTAIQFTSDCCHSIAWPLTINLQGTTSLTVLNPLLGTAIPTGNSRVNFFVTGGG